MESNWENSVRYGSTEVVRVGGMVLVRKVDELNHVLYFTEDEWDAFVKGAKNNEFDARVLP